jgi:aldose 1-epimerase
MHAPLTTPPSGKQYHISFAGYHAVIVELGAGIRLLERDDRSVLESYDEAAICDGAHGANLVPWPNRVFGGGYRFMGHDYRLPLTEPEAGNAIHGLVRWLPFWATHLTQTSVTLEAVLHPTPWYPFLLRVRFNYELSTNGLIITTELLNQGAQACPVAVGHHPYLSPGNDQTIDAALFSASANQTSPASEGSEVSVTHLEVPQPVGDRVLDTTFTIPTTAHGRRGWARLTGADHRTVELWTDQSYRYLQIFSGDTLPNERRRKAMAVEPMTAPPNALQSGQDLLVLQPQETLETQWGVGLR